MQITGNILLFLSLLPAGFLFKLTFLQKMPGGDYRVGYAWTILYSIVVFWVCLASVALTISAGGGFAWLSLGRFADSRMLILCFLILFLGANLGMEGRSIRLLAPVNAVLTPLVMLVTFAVLLNENLQKNVSPSIIKWALAGVLAINALVLATIILRILGSRMGRFLPRFSNKLDNFQLGILEQIERCDASKGITGLFIYSGNNQPRQIREKARLKIKSKPDWQEDLFRTLDTDGVDEAFRFLLANEVDDNAQFAKGVYQGVLKQAKLIRANLRRCSHPSHVYDGQFGFEVGRALEVVEKFKDLGVDFKPAVQELRAALDEPIAYDNPNPSCKKVLDKWLSKH